MHRIWERLLAWCAVRWAFQTENPDCFHWSFQGSSALIPIKPLNVINCGDWAVILGVPAGITAQGWVWCKSHQLRMQRSILHQYSIKPHIRHFHQWLNQSVHRQGCTGHLSALLELRQGSRNCSRTEALSRNSCLHRGDSTPPFTGFCCCSLFFCFVLFVSSFRDDSDCENHQTPHQLYSFLGSETPRV